MLELIPTSLLYTGMGLPLEDAAVVLSEEAIAGVGLLAEMRAMYPQATLRDPVSVIAPPPINAHTHLDLSTLPFERSSYPEFIGRVVAHRAGRTLEAAQEGLRALEGTRTGAIGDIVTQEAVMRHLLTGVDRPGVAYWEVFGPDPDHAERIFLETVERVRQFRALERPGFMRLGLSPHTAHTVSADLMGRLCRFARVEGLPLQIHIAESPEEFALFSSGTGPLAEVMERVSGKRLADILGVQPGEGLTPVRQLERLGVLEARPTLIHAVHAPDDDVARIARAGCMVVTCPRSNAALSCGTFDWPRFARHGVEVAVGTDSSASGQTLDVLDELRFARDLYGERVPMRTLVRAAVKGGARALGLRTPVLRRGEGRGALTFWPDL